MQKTLISVLFVSGLFSCRSNPATDATHDKILFNLSINPSFDESATFILSKTGAVQQLNCVILAANRNDRPADTFYRKTISLSSEQFRQFDSAVVQKTKIKQTPQKEGCCDGITFRFVVIRDTDTSMLHYGNLDIRNDTTACKIIGLTLDHLALLFKDSIVSDNFNDVNSYIYDSVKHSRYQDNRSINKLRKIDYGR